MRKLGISLAVALALIPGSAYAGTIVAPVAGVIDVGGPGFGSLTETFNQAGLLTGYTSGVTDFDTYIALDPQHNFAFAGNEWFSNDGTTTATVTYDLGSVMSVSRLALWHEDAAGFSLLNLLYSTDNITFTALASGLAPADNLINFNYGPEVFNFGATDARYIRFEMSGCPQPPDSGFASCAIGEVAFDTAAAVPEPATLLLFGAGLGAIALRRMRSRRNG